MNSRMPQEPQHGEPPVDGPTELESAYEDLSNLIVFAFFWVVVLVAVAAGGAGK